MERNIFVVVAGGNAAAERHFEDTILTHRNIGEVRQYLSAEEIQNLEYIGHSNIGCLNC